MSRSFAKTPRGDQTAVAALMAQGDLEEALARARELIGGGDRDAQVAVWAVECETLLERRYLASVGGAAAVLEVRSTPAQQVEMPLTPPSAFLLSMVDGFSTVEQLVDVSGMQRLDALRSLSTLVESGAVAIVATLRPLALGAASR